ncbi:TatD family hydrolase [Celerinatantimonas yamalensis]|uniref:TatD family hydrolase n=1 Tax=Celerinatantimonas yamalensis TaxID=559956 RepID=A0ABW9G9V0_9GAMM
MIDIALNLASSQFDSDRADVVERASQAGVTQFLLLASEVNEAEQLVPMAESFSGAYVTAGCHPHQASTFQTGDRQRIAQLCAHRKVVAVGECGLDYNRNYSDPSVQRDVFAQQLDIAIELQKPVLLHERDAEDDFMDILAPRLAELPAAVLHCFTGSAGSLTRYLDAGLYIGITGWICDERRGLGLRKLVPQIPASRLFLETDAPYLLPRDLPQKPKNRRNEPGYLPHIYQTVATLRGEPLEPLIAQIQTNFQQVFLNEIFSN